MIDVHAPDRTAIIDRGVDHDGWDGESSMRRRVAGDSGGCQSAVAFGALRRVRARAPAVRAPGDVPPPSDRAEAVSLWQLALMPHSNMSRSGGVGPAGQEWPALLDLVRQARNGQGIARRAWVSQWMAQRLKMWQSLGTTGRKPLRWELLRARLLAGAESRGELWESRERGFNRAFLIHASRIPLSITTIAQRQDLKVHCALKYELNLWWSACPLTHDGRLHRCEYYWMFGRVARLLLPDATDAEIAVLLLRDWDDDSGGRSMGQDGFERAFHVLLAVCCETPGASEAVEFASALRRCVFADGIPGTTPAAFRKFEITAEALRKHVDELLAPLRPVQHGHRLPDATDLATVSARCLLLNASPDAAVEQLEQVTGGLLHLPPPPSEARAARDALRRSERSLPSPQAAQPRNDEGCTPDQPPLLVSPTMGVCPRQAVAPVKRGLVLRPVRRYCPRASPPPRRAIHAPALAAFGKIARAAGRASPSSPGAGSTCATGVGGLEVEWRRKSPTASEADDGDDSRWSGESRCSSSEIEEASPETLRRFSRLGGFNFRQRDAYMRPGRRREEGKAAAAKPTRPALHPISPRTSHGEQVMTVAGAVMLPSRHGVPPDAPAGDLLALVEPASAAATGHNPVATATLAGFRPLKRLVPLPAKGHR